MGESSPRGGNRELPDRELFKASCDGNRDAYGEFVCRYSGPLFRYCSGRLGDYHLAQDVVQEAFLRVYRGMKEKIPEDPGSWLFGVARRCCQETERRWKKAIPLPPSGELAASSGKKGKGGELLDHLLERLTDEQRTLVHLKHVSGLTCREMARRMGKPLGTVTAALSRAYSRLRSLSAGEEDLHG